MARIKPKTPSAGKRILLIDDQKDYLESTIKLLEREGHNATGVSSADEMFYAVKRSKDKNTFEGSFPGHPSITYYENYEGMRVIIDHLIETHGYEKIGFVGIEEGETNTGFRERYKAFCDSMKEHSLSINPLFVVPYREWNRPANGVSMNDALDAWLKKSIPLGLKAVIGICDPTALWVINRCVKLGFSVPDDLAVVGYDNFFEVKVIHTPLTTVEHRGILTEAQSERERNLGLNLITTCDIDQLLDLLVHELPGLGISRFHVSLFEDPKR